MINLSQETEAALLDRAPMTAEQLIASMEKISVRCAARPVVDPRTADEIIGYDDSGLPR